MKHMTAHQPVVHDDILDPRSINHETVISEGVRNDFRMCLRQALEYLELGEHDGGWVVIKTIDLERVLELAEAVFEGCSRELEKHKR